MSLRLSQKGGRSGSSEGKETLNALSWGREQVDLGWARVSRAQPVLEVGSRAKRERGCPEKGPRAGKDTARRGLGRNENRTQKGKGPRSVAGTHTRLEVSEPEPQLQSRHSLKKRVAGELVVPTTARWKGSIWKLEGAEQRASRAEGVCLRDSRSGRMGVGRSEGARSSCHRVGGWGGSPNLLGVVGGEVLHSKIF